MTVAVTLPVISVVDDNSYLVGWNTWTSYASIPGSSFTPNHKYLIFSTTEGYNGYYATSVLLRNMFDGSSLDGSSYPAVCGGDSTRRQYSMVHLVTAPPATGAGFQLQASRQGGVSGNLAYIYRTRIVAIDLDVDTVVFPNSEKGWLLNSNSYSGVGSPDTTFGTGATQTFTGDGSDYLVIATGTLIAGGNAGYAEFRLNHDVDADIPLSKIYGLSYTAFSHAPTCTIARVFSALSGSHTFSAQLRRVSGGAGPGAMANSRIVVIRLKSFTGRTFDYYNPGSPTSYADTAYHAYRTTPATAPAVTTGDTMVVFRCLESSLFGTATTGCYINRLTQLPSAVEDYLYTLAGLQQVGYYPYDNYDEKEFNFAIAVVTADNATPQFSQDVAGNTANYPSHYRSTIVALKAEVSAPIVRHQADSFIVTGGNPAHYSNSLLQKAAQIGHGTNSYLIPTPKQHTTDSRIYILGQKDHFTDSVLLGNLQVTHGTDCLAAGLVREPDLATIAEFTSVVGDNVGAYDVTILGPSGNSKAPQQFVYDRPSQEAVLSKSENIKLDIVDRVIKDKA
jgi:hypothetical protein